MIHVDEPRLNRHFVDAVPALIEIVLGHTDLLKEMDAVRFGAKVPPSAETMSCCGARCRAAMRREEAQ
jgi:hypothetical protein